MRFRLLRYVVCCFFLFMCLGIRAYSAPLKYGDILVANGTGSNIIKVDPVTGAQEVFASGSQFVRPLGITVTDTGRIFVTDPRTSSDTLFEIDPITGAATARTTGFNRDPSGVSVGSDGTIFVSEQLGSSGIAFVDPSSYSIVSRSGGSLYNRPMLSTFLDNGLLLVPNRGNGNIVLLDPSTGLSTLLASGFAGSEGSSVEDDGTVIVPGGGDTLYRINPETGQSLVLASGFGNLNDVAVAPDGFIYTTDLASPTSNGAAIWRIDPVTGLGIEISAGGEFVEPFGIAVYLPEPSSFIALTAGCVACFRRRPDRRRGRLAE